MKKNQTLEILRDKLGLTKKDFAKALGITQNAYTNYIQGKRDIPTPLALTIKQMYDINLNWLLTGEGEMYPQNKSVVIKGNHINGIANSNIAVRENIKIKLHPKNVSDDEDELLESYRSLPKELREVYLYRIKADAIEHRLRRNINE